MRILIISGHYSTDIGYQEVHLARAYSRAGHTVRVLTTTYVPDAVQKVRPRSYTPGLIQQEGYEIERLKLRFRWKTVLIPNGAKESISSFRPDVVIGIAIAKYMPLLGLNLKQQLGHTYIAIFGDRFNDRQWSGHHLTERFDVWSQQLAFLWKQRWYDQTLRLADRIVYTVPETFDFLQTKIPIARQPEVVQKMAFVPLGFDERMFYFDPEARQMIRARHHIQDDEIALITATKLTPTKKIDRLVNQIGELLASGMRLRFFLIGFGQDTYSRSIQDQINQQGLTEHIVCLPFMSHEELRGYYGAADLGYWPLEAISIQEAMGTGLPVLLKDDKIVAHLVEDNVNGFLIEDRDQMPLGIQRAYEYLIGLPDRLSFRLHLADGNSRLSYRQLSKQILDLETA